MQTHLISRRLDAPLAQLDRTPLGQWPGPANHGLEARLMWPCPPIG